MYLHDYIFVAQYYLETYVLAQLQTWAKAQEHSFKKAQHNKPQAPRRIEKEHHKTAAEAAAARRKTNGYTSSTTKYAAELIRSQQRNEHDKKPGTLH